MGTGVNKGWMGMNEDHETHHQISMLLNEVLIMQYISTFGNFGTNYIICTNVQILNNFFFFFFFFSKEQNFVKEIKESFGIFFYLTWNLQI
jgi:hypothetical protein